MSIHSTRHHASSRATTCSQAPHVPGSLQSRSSRATTCHTRLPCIASYHISPRVTSAHVSIPIVDRLLLTLTKVKISQQGLSCLRRFWFWALFLHLRTLNPTFWSFSSLWLNKTTKILFVLSLLCWMVLLAIMCGLRIWLSFSRVINCEDMWLVQFLSQYQTLSPKPQLLKMHP